MRNSPRIPIAFIIVCNVMVVTFALLPVVPSEVCKQHYHHPNENCTTYEVFFFLITHVGDFLTKYEAAFTAAFTLAVAIFTWRLWVSTEKLWDEARSSRELTTLSVNAAAISANAASRTAKAVVAAELPILDSISQKFVAYDFNTGDRAQTQPGEYERLPPNTFGVEMIFENSGRTPAYLHERSIRMYVGEALPAQPNYGRVVQIDDILRPDKPMMLIKPPGDGAIAHIEGRDNFRLTLTAQERMFVDTNRSILWIYGFVSYDDFIGTRHKKGFCYRWWVPYIEGTRRGFLRDGGKNYNYTRDE